MCTPPSMMAGAEKMSQHTKSNDPVEHPEIDVALFENPYGKWDG